ncbi:recombination protein O N-terminal domain-containing protein, partial [Streptomyces sp. NRRL S-1896]|uniref:recombination protein O N-terminal domain-containing protein n=1 Tax=Streptomyces sp. NRRL S-1896 TaxID=1463893 RepID=UPI001F3192AA
MSTPAETRSRGGDGGPARPGPDRAARPVRDNGPMSLFRDDGVVLRTQKLGEADRIITFLTRG